MSTLSLRLFGTIEVFRDGKPVDDFVTRKAQALFIYLAATRKKHTRAQLATLFWPDLSEQSAKNNLRRVLPSLRKRFAEHLTITNHTIAFARNAPYELDIERFVDADTSDGVASMPVAQLRIKADLYRGEFLQGFHLPDTPEFDQWVLLEREYFRQQSIRLLTALAKCYLQSRDTDDGLATTKRLLEIEPWYEAGHHLQMLLLAQSGQSTAALAQYESCRKLLADEFGTEPSATMRSAYEQIKLGQYPMAGSSEAIPTGIHDAALPLTTDKVQAALASALRLDCYDMPRAANFYGRQAEMGLLRRWLVLEQKTLIGVSGTGGMGKTAFVAELVRTLAEGTRDDGAVDTTAAPLSRIIWRSLSAMPPLATLVSSWLNSLLAERTDPFPSTLYEQLDLLFACLRKERCLLVLDNLESILQKEGHSGSFRKGYEEYEYLFQRIGETEHRSSLLFTSREQPLVLGRLERSYPMVCSYTLKGLDRPSGLRLLRAEGLQSAESELFGLIDRYSGNPLALKLVAETIQDLYAGDAAILLQDRSVIFDDIQAVLNEQFNRLSPVEMEILCWFAIEGTPVTLWQLGQNWLSPLPRRKFLEAIRSLQRRNLIEPVITGTGSSLPADSYNTHFAMPHVVLEYVRELLVENLFTELVQTPVAADRTGQRSVRMHWLGRYTLLKAQSKPYVRNAQQRLLLQPLLRRLSHHCGEAYLPQHLTAWLDFLHQQSPLAAGYAATNILHLLLQLEVDLNAYDFSGLSLRQADLCTGALAHANLQGANLTDAAFLGTFDLVITLALSANGDYLAAGASNNCVYLWHMEEYRLHGTLHHHMRPIRALVFIGDGTRLACGSLDGSVSIWDLERKELLQLLTANGKSIVALAAHPHEPCLAAATADGVVYLWHYEEPNQEQVLATPTKIEDLAFTPDGQWLICVGDQRAIRIWHVQERQWLHTLHGHAGKILAVAIHPQGHSFATGGEDGKIWLWDMATMQPSQELVGHTDFVLDLAYAPYSAQLVSCGADHVVRIWDLSTGQQNQVLRGHHGWVQTMAYFPEGRTVVSSGYDQTIRFWDINSGQLQQILQGYHNQLDFTHFSRDGRVLAASGLDGAVQIWDVTTAELCYRLRGPKGATRQVLFSAEHPLIVTASDDHVVRLWDRTDGRLKAEWHGHTGPVRCIAFTPDEQYLFSGSHDQTLHIWDVKTGKLQELIPNVAATIDSAIAVCPTKQYWAFSTLDGTIHVRDLVRGETVQRLKLADTTGVVLTFESTGMWLACGTENGQVLLYGWSAADGLYRLRYCFQETQFPIWRLLFSPDGGQLVWISAGQELYRFDLESGKVAEPIRTHFGVFCLAFAQDSRTFFTDGPDYTLLMREAKTGAVIKTLPGHTAGITSISCSPTTGKLVSSSLDGTLHLWDGTSGDCLGVMQAPGPYAGMKIGGVTGISDAQRQGLIELGAVVN